MADTIKLVPVRWHNGAWHGDGTLEFEIPEGWEYLEVKDFNRLSGNQLSALIVLRKQVDPAVASSAA